MSLLYTLQGLDRTRFSPVVATARPGAEVATLYRDSGFECSFAPGLNLFVHTNGGHRHWLRPSAWWHWYRDGVRDVSAGVRKLLADFSPDIVHLNGSPLAQAARALSAERIPFLWHIREHPRTTSDFRTRWLQDQMRSCRGEMVFLSKTDRLAWTGGDHGHVLHNFVDTTRFGGYDEHAIRGELGLGMDTPVALYLGGFSEIKGFSVLTQALHNLRGSGLRCLMPGCLVDEIAVSVQVRAARVMLPLVGLATNTQRGRQQIDRLGLSKICMLMPFQRDVLRLMAVADVVVFPATHYHFPRPVIEAAAMGRAVIASDFPGMEEIVEHGHTGVLVRPNDPGALSGAIETLLKDRAFRDRLGRTGRTLALERFDRKKNCERFMEILDLAIEGRRPVEAGAP